MATRRRVVLAVGVEGDDVARVGVADDVVEAGLQRGALPEVQGMAEHGRPGGAGDVGRAVAAAVVDDDHVAEVFVEGGQDVGEHASLVVRRHDDNDVISSSHDHHPASRK